jgi:hypothetical protein
MEKVELVKRFRELYTAGRKVNEVTAEKGVFLCVDGGSEPGGREFEKAIGLLYTAAYTLKSLLKKSGKLNYTVSKLECLWTSDLHNAPMSEWHWRLMIRIPDEVTNDDIKDTRKLVQNIKGLDASGVKRVSWKEGRALQVMHVGPYNEVGKSYGMIQACAGELGYRPKGPGHEIYISSPRHVEPGKRKTIVRMPISRPRPTYAGPKSASRSH